MGVPSPRQSFSRGEMRKRWEQEAQGGRRDEKKALKGGCEWVEVRGGGGEGPLGVWQGGVQVLDAQSRRVRTE